MRNLYPLDENYFAAIDTEDRGYWLGFGAADGCLYDNHRRQSAERKAMSFSIGLAIADRGHLEKFREAIGYGGPIGFGASKKNGKVYQSCHINIGRTAFCRHLLNHGIRPRKSLTLEPPTTVPDDMTRHYYRGFFDGDGTVYRSPKSGMWKFGAVGTEAFLTAFSAFLKLHTGVEMTMTRQGKIWQAATHGIQHPQLVARLLYQDATVYLDRKKVLVDELLAEAPQRPQYLLVNGKAERTRDAAQRLNLKSSTITRRIKRGMSAEDATSKPDLKCVFLTHGGETLSITEWADRIGVKRETIYARLAFGDSPERALRPARKYTKKSSTPV